MPSRRTLLTTLAAGGTALAGCASRTPLDPARYTPGTDDTTDWPLPGFDPGGSGYSPAAAAPRTGVTARWSIEAGWQQGRPVVADGTLLYPEPDALVALDTASGEERWRYSREDDGFHPTAAAIADSTVYLGTATSEGGVSALDLADGTERWTIDTRGSVRVPVTVTDDVRWVFAGDDTGRIYQIDPADGTVEHTRDVFAGVSSLAYHRSLTVGTSGGELYAFYDDGDRLQGLWRRKLGGKVTAHATHDGTTVAATFGGPLYRLSDGAHAGRSRWEYDRGTIHLALTGHAVVGADGGGLRVVDDREGTERWSREGRYDASPAVAGDTVYVGTEGGVDAYALGSAPLDGRRRWRFETDSRVAAGLAVADGAVFAVTTGDEEHPARVHALDAA